MSITARLQQYIDHAGLSINQAADRCGLNRATLHKALRTGRGLHSETLVAVLTTWPELSADWLLLGVGTMLRRHPRLKADDQSGQNVPLAAEPQEPYGKTAERMHDATRLQRQLQQLLVPENMQALIELLEERRRESQE